MGRKIDRAKTALEEAETIVVQWTERVDKLETALEGAVADAGHRAFESGDPEEAARRVSDTREQLAVARLTVPIAESARDEAHARVLEAEADELRPGLKKATDKAVRHKRAVAEVRKRLEELDGVPYAIDVRSPELGGTVKLSRSRTFEADASDIRSEIQRLERRAAALREEAAKRESTSKATA